MATLKKMTRMGADVRQIARLLQAKAPEGHMLAYITPEEAKLLKSQGGSGKEHEDTGIPSFENEFSYDMYGETAAPPISTSSAPVPIEQDKFNFINDPKVNPDSSSFVGPRQEDTLNRLFRESGITSAPVSTPETPYLPQGAFPAGAYAPPEGGAGRGYEPYQIDTTPPKGVIDTLVEKTGLSKETLARLGLAAGGSLYGAYQSKKAAEQGQAAKREQQALAAPYKQQGAELQRAAQAGELTPVAQQQLQAVQAQAAQQAAGRGGAVSAAQTQAQVEAFRNQLLQQQYDYGLKLSGIGDNIALGAIKTGLEADRYVQNLSNSFYSNMANIAAGMPAQAQAQQRTA